MTFDPNARFGPRDLTPEEKTEQTRQLEAVMIEAKRQIYASVEESADQATKSRKASYVGTPAIFQLELACQPINDAFDGYGCYLVGSALQRPDWRDIDVRFIMSDDAFMQEFPGTFDPTKGMAHWEFDAKWILICTGIAEYLKRSSGLPVDFQIQPQSHANERHKGMRHALGLRFAKPEPP